jgi:hypothetical protein
MGKPYSQDLRERVIAAVDTGTGAYLAALLFQARAALAALVQPSFNPIEQFFATSLAAGIGEDARGQGESDSRARHADAERRTPTFLPWIERGSLRRRLRKIAEKVGPDCLVGEVLRENEAQALPR